jgi:DNA replication protein DnaC
LWQRPSEEEIQRKIEAKVGKTHSNVAPLRLLDAEIRKCEVVFNRFESLFITGPAGTGKSYMASAILKEEGRWRTRDRLNRLYEGKEKHGEHYELPPDMGVTLNWITVPNLLLELRGSFKDKAESTEQDIVQEYSTVDMLILDDLGAEKSSEFSIQSLYLIIDHRYSEMRDTIITSNLSLREISEKVGDRIASRIAGMCRVIELKGRDRRLLETGK